MAVLATLAIVIIMPQPLGIRALVIITILRLIFSVGLEPTLFLLGAFNLFDLVYREETLLNVIKSVTRNGRSIVLTAVLALILVYLFSIVGYIFFKDDFILEVDRIPNATLKNGASMASEFLSAGVCRGRTDENCTTGALQEEHGSNSEEDDDMERTCDSLLMCIVTVLSHGLRSGGGVGDVLRKPSKEEPLFAARVIYDLLFFFMVIIIVLNLIFGVIIDTFADLRSEKQKKEEVLKTTCFICGLERDKFDNKTVTFEEHIKEEHNMWHYLFFIVLVKVKDSTEYTGPESYVAEMIKEHNLDWFPRMRAMSLVSSDAEGEQNEIRNLQEKLESTMRLWVSNPLASRAPGPVELLLWSPASTFPEPWRAQPCFHTLQHGGTRDRTRAAPALTSAAVRPLRLLIGRKWAVPPPRIQRRLTREPHVTEETYKLPHRLIEKKRRDRINECIAQLKDLLPEHLKLTQQKILALQSGMQIEQPPVNQEKSEEMFRSGFHMCAKEILQYLANHETDDDFTPSHAINHLHKLAAEVLQSPARPRTPLSPRPEEIPTYHQHQPHKEMPTSLPPKPSEGYGRNCVPVIQRAYAPASSEQSGSDTDTDSGYGGELEKAEPGAQQGRPDYYVQESQLKRVLGERQSSGIKQEDDEPRHKRPRVESSEDELLSGGESSSSSSGYGSYMSVSPNHPPPPHPLCMPFYLIPPSAAAYLPMLEKCWYPGAMPMLYPGMGGSSPAMPSERPPPPQLVLSPRGGSPAPAISQTPMDSPALLQALKQVPPLNLETKD
ncbi:Inositol 1,4,5-trisphosphate receptor type 1 IP3 receptor isoform 1 [Collichthys lucidus]|uniref:Inositol 1,4,5-trisphosphate receptor type 1 IP3 receptor isoform 1 n=1 Tax=Collichthys lucidus TaxID=240159 RepID=A0A4V6AN71_COLLU|nr:Inositol 1,4,5-trisphosphate receptor type 1 IP3 receptor isoform 1 [Collichthys lucidus]